MRSLELTPDAVEVSQAYLSAYHGRTGGAGGAGRGSHARLCGPHCSVVASLSLQGMDAQWVIDGSIDGPAFLAYVTDVLAPTLRKCDVVILDDLQARKPEAIRAVITAHDAGLVFLPPYSLDIDSIELCWATVKGARARPKRTASTRCVPLCCRSLKNWLGPGLHIVVINRRQSFGNCL